MLVKEIMKRPFIVERDISLKEAAKIMKDKGIGSLIFVSNSKVKGIITETDTTRDFGKNEKISQVMKPNVITINAEENVDRAVEIMKENKRVCEVREKEADIADSIGLSAVAYTSHRCIVCRPD